MSHYKPYPACKDSGVEWIGEVPEHWEVKRLKYSATINDEALPETTDPALEMIYVDISSVNEIEGIVANEEMIFENAPSRARRIVRDGDTIVSTVRTYLRAIAPIRSPRLNTIVSTGFAVIRPQTVKPAFMSYALRESGFVEAIVTRSVGVSYPAINSSEIGNIPFELPPSDEQLSIVSFLDQETSRIDTLISEKERLISLLQEYRQALISHAVTKGLDPKVKMKDSGVEWLGKVPEHWEVKRLKHIADVRLSNVDKHTVEGQKVVRLCNYLDVYNNRSITSKIDFISATASDEQIERLSLQKDDVIITKDSEDPSDIGIPALVEEDIFGLVCGYHLAVLRPTAAIGEYLHYLFQSTFVRSAFEVEATGMTRYALGKYAIENLTLALPHQSEQTSIDSFLDQETIKIDQLIATAKNSIVLLQERRSALISAAVTGKIDIRGYHV